MPEASTRTLTSPGPGSPVGWSSSSSDSIPLRPSVTSRLALRMEINPLPVNRVRCRAHCPCRRRPQPSSVCPMGLNDRDGMIQQVPPARHAVPWDNDLGVWVTGLDSTDAGWPGGEVGVADVAGGFTGMLVDGAASKQHSRLGYVDHQIVRGVPRTRVKHLDRAD